MVYLLGNDSQSVICQVDEKIKEKTDVESTAAWASEKQSSPEKMTH